MAKKRLVSAMVSITSFNEDLRRYYGAENNYSQTKLKVIEELE
jgi:hypothetical protein